MSLSLCPSNGDDYSNSFTVCCRLQTSSSRCTVNSGSSQMVSWLIKCPSLPLKQAFLNTICFLIEVTDVNVHLAITSCVMCSQISPEKGTSS
ncbi:hypothetical protein MTR67_030502 [Solanum verrucosum]|uniref:Uncharacterized protein n=1 Tax=Solanum verrucosum TaxID=315347 RepID=A0AAF0TXR5_SOLVR|nr:hypothetical protein MTR67_030502 [Solanum verrucosum]